MIRIPVFWLNLFGPVTTVYAPSVLGRRRDNTWSSTRIQHIQHIQTYMCGPKVASSTEPHMAFKGPNGWAPHLYRKPAKNTTLNTSPQQKQEKKNWTFETHCTHNPILYVVASSSRFIPKNNGGGRNSHTKIGLVTVLLASVVRQLTRAVGREKNAEKMHFCC